MTKPTKSDVLELLLFLNIGVCLDLPLYWRLLVFVWLVALVTLAYYNGLKDGGDIVLKYIKENYNG